MLSRRQKLPYHVLLDGNFIHTALAFRMEDLQRRLGALLQAGAKKNLKLSVTPCILAELASLGAEFQGTYDWAKDNLSVVECSHDREPQDPYQCVKSIIGEDNARHYFVASQDAELRSQLGNVLGGATLFISVNGVHITQPTEAQKQLAAQGLSESMLPSTSELKTEPLGALHRFKQPLRTSSKFRKAKKGNPNPLSVKPAAGSKKKRPGPRLRNALKAAALAAQGSDQPSGDGTETKKKKRRKKKKPGTAEANEVEAQA